MEPELIYLDHAATSLDKVDGLGSAMATALKMGNPGRSGHGPGVEGSRLLFETRHLVSQMLSVENESNVVFTSGASSALNMVIFGTLDHKNKPRVLSTDLEHNSVARPLADLEKKGMISWQKLPSAQGDFFKNLSELNLDGVALVCVNHVSNVSGVRQDVLSVAQLCREKSIPLLLDASQSLGCEHVDMSMGDYICASAHKGLKGPMGVGILAMSQGRCLSPMFLGGTGSLSEKLDQPDFLPDALESGTANLPGISGLKCALEALGGGGMKKRSQKLQLRRDRVYEGLLSLGEAVRIYGPKKGGTALSFTTPFHDMGDITHQLWHKQRICLRAGLHCSPLAHQALGTFPEGTIRVSPSFETSEEQIDFFLASLRSLVKI